MSLIARGGSNGPGGGKPPLAPYFPRLWFRGSDSDGMLPIPDLTVRSTVSTGVIFPYQEMLPDWEAFCAESAFCTESNVIHRTFPDWATELRSGLLVVFSRPLISTF